MNKSLSFHFVEKHKHFIWGTFLDSTSECRYNLCGVYESPKQDEKLAFINILKGILTSEPWLIIGDYRFILIPIGKYGCSGDNGLQHKIHSTWKDTNRVVN